MAAKERGIKHDNDKPEMYLLQDFSLALLELGKVATFGAKKYSPGNWLHVKDGFNRYTSAMIRHFCEEGLSSIDHETDLYHAAHTAWNALARLEFLMRNGGKECRK